MSKTVILELNGPGEPVKGGCEHAMLMLMLHIVYGLGQRRSAHWCIIIWLVRYIPPPKSPSDFLNPHLPPADISWAHTLYCDVVVALTELDVYNKVCHRITIGCHLGYDDWRRGH